MKRREFIRKTSAIGLSGLVGQGCSSTIHKAGRTTEPGFDIHPFINNHPEAVFIVKTSIKSKKDFAEIKKVGLKLASEIIVKSKSGGFPNSKLITLKHNWHGKKKIDDLLAMNTEPNFTAGWVEGMKEAGPQRY